MAQDIFHVPVLESEIVELFAQSPTGVVVDATWAAPVTRTRS